jgi:hypothetical protein
MWEEITNKQVAGQISGMASHSGEYHETNKTRACERESPGVSSKLGGQESCARW